MATSLALSSPALGDVLDFGLMNNGSGATRVQGGVQEFWAGKAIPNGKSIRLGTGPQKFHGRAKATAPAKHIQLEITATAQRYVNHKCLRVANLGRSEWPLFFQAMLQIESGFDPVVTSSAGAIGLGQLMPQTAAELGVDPTDIRQNLDGAARYLLQQCERYGSVELALAAYNAGPGAVDKYGGVPPFEETQNHISKVMGVFNQLKKGKISG